MESELSSFFLSRRIFFTRSGVAGRENARDHDEFGLRQPKIMTRDRFS
jgi:hypothetical protein